MVHEASTPQDRHAPWTFRLKNRFTLWRGRRAERRVFSRSRTVIANSFKTRDEVVTHYGVSPEQVEVVYLGIDPAEFPLMTTKQREAARTALGVAAGQILLAFVGALGFDSNKGFDTLLKSLTLLRCPLAKFKVVAAGEGRLDYWKKSADSLGLAPVVQFVGKTTRVAELLGAADLLVSPSRYDSYGLTVHEAICCGTPAVVSPNAGVAERFPKSLSGLILSDPDDAYDLARRIEDGWDRLPVLRAEVGDFGRELRSRTWQDVA